MSGEVVVLGGTGFVGAALATELRRRGTEVHAVGRSEIDLAAPAAGGELAARLGPGSTLVVAARTRAAADNTARFASDVAITAAAAAAIEQGRPRRCVYFSSFAVYGEHTDEPSITEETPPAPSSYYGAARFAGELVVGLAASRAQVPLLVVRPSSVYGPGDETGSYGPGRFVREILADGRVRLFGDGRELRDYVYVEDVARALAELLDRDVVGIFNVASGESVSFAELAELLGRVAASPFEVVEAPRIGPIRGSQRAVPVRLLAELPGFRFTQLDEGLAATYAAAAAATSS